MKGLLAVSISLFAAALIFAMSASTLSNIIFAEPEHICIGHPDSGNCPGRTCENDPPSITCCWDGASGTECQSCTVELPSGDLNCGPVTIMHNAGGGAVVNAPPTNIAPPKTKTCPDGSVINADDKCPPATQGLTDQGTTLPPANDNTDIKHHKGNNLGQLGGSLVNGDNNPSPSTSTGANNDKPSKHHKD